MTSSRWSNSTHRRQMPRTIVSYWLRISGMVSALTAIGGRVKLISGTTRPPPMMIPPTERG